MLGPRLSGSQSFFRFPHSLPSPDGFCVSPGRDLIDSEDDGVGVFPPRSASLLLLLFLIRLHLLFLLLLFFLLFLFLLLLFSSSSSSNNTHYFIVPVSDPSLPDDWSAHWDELSAHWDDLSAHWDDLRSVYPLGRFVCPGSGSYSSANVNYLFCPVSKWSSSTNWDVFTGIRLVCQMGIVC